MVIATLLCRISFLLDSYQGIRFVQQRAIRVPEDVPTDPGKAVLFTSRLQNLLLNDARVVAAACNVRREDKPTRTVPFPAT